MLSSGAADCNDHMRLVLAVVRFERKVKIVAQTLYKFLRLAGCHDIVVHFLLIAGLFAQARLVKWIGQEADVDDLVRIHRDTVFKAERLERDRKFCLFVRAEPVADAVGKRLRCQLGRIHMKGVLRVFLQMIEIVAFHFDRIFKRGCAVGRDHRMLAARKAVAQQQLIVAAVQKNDLDIVGVVVKVFHKINVVDGGDRQRYGFIFRLFFIEQGFQIRKQLFREVIDTVIAEIFERVHGAAFSGPGHAGYQNDIFIHSYFSLLNIYVSL